MLIWGIPVHIGADAFERTHPFRAAKIAARHPGLPMLIAPMGGVGFADLTAAAIEFAQQHPDMTLVGSGVREPPIGRAIKSLGASRVCFGSDTPFGLMHVELAEYRALLEGEVTEEERRLVMGGSVAGFLGLAS